jgi:hypothetical protein
MVFDWWPTMSFWRRRKGLDEHFGIEAGQRFRAVGSTPIFWEVAAVARHDWEVAPHVRLHRVGVPTDGKTISLQVLRDRKLFLPAEQ